MSVNPPHPAAQHTSSVRAAHLPDALDLDALAAQLIRVPGVVGVVLGGSRARGDHTPSSDVDLGLYDSGSAGGIDTTALGALAREVGGSDAQVSEHGGWGPWVDGGGWITIAGTAVDWIYRDLDRVDACWALAERGEYAFTSKRATRWVCRTSRIRENSRSARS